jgi:hypothetical protein
MKRCIFTGVSSYRNHVTRKQLKEREKVMSTPESRSSLAGGAKAVDDTANENTKDVFAGQRATPNMPPSSVHQSGVEGGGNTNEAAAQVAAQLAELMRSNPEAFRDLLAQAAQSTGLASGQVQQQPLSRFDKQKENLVKGLGTMVEEVRQMNRNLRRSEQGGILPVAAQYGDLAADRVERLSHYLSGRKVSELVGETARFVHRNATYIVPGAFLLGLLGARFLKSSSPMPTEIAGWQRGELDVAPPAPPPGEPVAAAAASSTAGGSTLDRGAQAAQSGSRVGSA